MPLSPGQRQQARQEALKRYNASGKGKARRQRYRAEKCSERAQVKGQEIRDDSGRLIARRLPDGTIQAVTVEQQEEQ